MYDRLHSLANVLNERKFRKVALAYFIYQYALKYGNFTFASGIKSNNKFDLELLPDDAHDLTADILVDIIGEKRPDMFFGVPNGGNPVAERVASRLRTPQILTYKEGNLPAIKEDSYIGSGIAYGFEDAITTGGSTLRTIERVQRYASEKNHSIIVPRVFATIRRMESTPEGLLSPRGVDLSYIFTTRELLGWLIFLYERRLIELDSRWNEMWRPNL